MKDGIKVSFVNNDDEKKLYDDIIKASKDIGKSKWIKIAAREKLERDRINEDRLRQFNSINMNVPQQINHFNSGANIIDGMDAEQFFN